MDNSPTLGEKQPHSMGNVGKCALHGASGCLKHVYCPHGPLHACLFVILHGPGPCLAQQKKRSHQNQPVESGCGRFVLIFSSTNSDVFLLPRKLTRPLKIGLLILLSCWNGTFWGDMWVFGVHIFFTCELKYSFSHSGIKNKCHPTRCKMGGHLEGWIEHKQATVLIGTFCVFFWGLHNNVGHLGF